MTTKTAQHIADGDLEALQADLRDQIELIEIDESEGDPSIPHGVHSWENYELAESYADVALEGYTVIYRAATVTVNKDGRTVIVEATLRLPKYGEKWRVPNGHARYDLDIQDVIG